jgi:hypothetical protein
MAGDSNTGKYLRECRSGIRVLMKQGDTKDLFRVLNSLLVEFSPRPAAKQSGRACLELPLAALF